MPPASDPVRMYLVLRRGAVEELSRAGELAGAAAVACIRRFSDDPAFAEAFEEWRPRPGKVCLRARTESQWQQVRAEPHAEAGDPEGESAVALPPRRRSERGPLLERLQAMSSDLRTAPARAAESDSRSAVTYVLNPAAVMSSGKTVAQVAHAAVMAADGGGVEDRGGLPGPRARPVRGRVRGGGGARRLRGPRRRRRAHGGAAGHGDGGRAGAGTGRGASRVVAGGVTVRT